MKRFLENEWDYLPGKPGRRIVDDRPSRPSVPPAHAFAPSKQVFRAPEFDASVETAQRVERRTAGYRPPRMPEVTYARGITQQPARQAYSDGFAALLEELDAKTEEKSPMKESGLPDFAPRAAELVELKEHASMPAQVEPVRHHETVSQKRGSLDELLDDLDAEIRGGDARYGDLDVETYASGAGDDDPSEMRSMNGKWYRDQARPKLPGSRYFGDRYGSSYGEVGAYRRAINLSRAVHGKEQEGLGSELREHAEKSERRWDRYFDAERRLAGEKDEMRHGYGASTEDYRARSRKIDALKRDLERIPREQQRAFDDEIALRQKSYQLSDDLIMPIVHGSRRGFGRESHHTKPERARGTGQSPRNTSPNLFDDADF